jgi:serine/threonine protein kinase
MAPPGWTRDGAISGTPAYMAPEIALGRGPVDGRSDLYSLGCVAYYLLTGGIVFDEPTAMSAALAHVQQQPVLPPRRSELPIPESIERIVMECLEKDPGRRPESAWELARRMAVTDVPRFAGTQRNDGGKPMPRLRTYRKWKPCPRSPPMPNKPVVSGNVGEPCL